MFLIQHIQTANKQVKQNAGINWDKCSKNCGGREQGGARWGGVRDTRHGCEHPEWARFVVHRNRFSSVPNTSSPPTPDAHLGPFLARRVSLA